MASALNNLKRVDKPLNKKPQTNQFLIINFFLFCFSIREGNFKVFPVCWSSFGCPNVGFNLLVISLLGNLEHFLQETTARMGYIFSFCNYEAF